VLNIGNGDSKDTWSIAAQTALHYSHFAYSLLCAKVGLVPSLTEVGGQSGGGLTKIMKGAVI